MPAASVVNLIAIRQALVPADAEHRFGHGKAEPLAGLVQVAFILGSSVVLAVEVVDRFRSGAAVTAMETGVAVMVVSLVVTGVLVLLQRHVVRRTGSIAIRSDQAHYATDFLVNVSVIAALVLQHPARLVVDRPGDRPLHRAVHRGRGAAGRQGCARHADGSRDGRGRPHAHQGDRARASRGARTCTICAPAHRAATRSSSSTWSWTDRSACCEAHRISDAVEADVRAAFPGAEVIIHEDPAGVVEQRATFRYH